MIHIYNNLCVVVAVVVEVLEGEVDLVGAVGVEGLEQLRAAHTHTHTYTNKHTELVRLSASLVWPRGRPDYTAYKQHICST